MSEKRTGAEEVIWDLGDLYRGMDDERIVADLDGCDAAAAELDGSFRGKIAELTPAELRTLIERYEAVHERGGRAASYASLNWTANTEDAARGALLQRVTERASQLEQKLVFVELELADAPESAAERWLTSPDLERYWHWLEKVRLYSPHLLSEAEEKILSEKAVTGRSAWDRYFDETHAAARYDLDGEKLSGDKLLSRLYAPDRDLRQRAAAAMTAGLIEMKRTNTFILNTLLADKASDDRLRNYPSWISARNLSNEVDDAVVEALVAAVTSRYDIVARYYRLKRRLLGLDALYDYDRYAPLPAVHREVLWPDAQRLVLEAYGGFHARMAELASRFFDRRWIDAASRPGKYGGAFSHGTVPSVHPYILMNYDARPRDVMTLAHELGHGVHQLLSGKQGALQAHTPLTTAETASVFGEMLVFQSLLRNETDRTMRLGLLTEKIEDAFATAFRQIAMNRFEDAIHNARRAEGELSTDRFNALWLETQRAMFGDSLTLTDDYGIWWSYIPHFVGTPGYVYAYAFGELLVLALYAQYQQAGPGFGDLYLEMLGRGGSEWPHEMVRPLGVDLKDPGFWRSGLGILEDLVAEAERLAAEPA
jgi:oligoendopeptidase F